VTFVLTDGARTVYFAGDTLLIPELAQLPHRFGHIDIALLPTNGLQIRPQANRQVVMNPWEAAELTAILAPQLAVPHHYAFTSGWLGDRLLTKSDPDPQHFARAARELAPGTEVRIARPGTRVAL
jgi:L-ascorbate metabolism protein UlaG (beta-lactamase superfamily)